ncbi:MAG: hypothetical protein LC722_01175, partial [Actinobacteria bacterium]|nr:hypothetical protein [Actinomycetota bacterium]
MDHAEGLDVVLHALAQTPPAVHAAVWGAGPSAQSLAALARAYGIGDRVEFGAEPGSITVRDTVLHPSSANLGAALVRANDPARDILMEPGGWGVSFARLVEGMYEAGDAAAPVPAAAALNGARVAVVVNHPAHYRIPLFNLVAERLEAVGGALRVLFQARSYARREFMRPPAMRFDHVFLSSLGVTLSPAWHPFISRDLGVQLRRFRPSVTIAAGFSPLVSGWAGREARAAGAAFGVWSGETSATAAARSDARRAQRRQALSRVDFGVAYGIASATYLRGLRPDLPVAIARNCISPPEPGGPPGRTRRGRPLEVLTV